MHERMMNIKYAVITVSDSRFNELVSGIEFEDKSGEFLKKELDAKVYHMIPDNKFMLKGLIDHFIDYCEVDCIVITGGTGLTKRDTTPDVLKEIYEKELDGFKIIFHKLSYDEVGFSTILSRASAGSYKGKIIFSLPGSLNACKTGVEIIKKETGHILGHLK